MEMAEITQKLFSSPAGPQWQAVGVRHHHGICFPLFSILTANSSGIGEYLDLIPMLHFCKEIGFDVIQLLPLNDNGLGKSPYSSISAFALNPLHLSLSALPNIERIPGYSEKLQELKKFNESPRVQYDEILPLRRQFLKDWFEHNFHDFANQESYQTFVRENAWLKPYALFKSIKENQKWTSWEEWPPSLKSPSDNHYEELLREFARQIDFHMFIQYFCFEQFAKVKKEAETLQLSIKGDIPILIGRDSADLWHYRRYFFSNLSAGAPPDMYSKDGQSWGFPVYDWDSLEKKGFDWWKERLKLCSHLYHIYRIDHIVGFYRIWAIGQGKRGNEGFFLPGDENLWIPQGEKLMKMMLETAPILPIGEDLGTVPPIVRTSLRNMGICGTKVIRWERYWDTTGDFIPFSEYIPESMTTVSTHDSETLQLWWKHSPKEAKLYCDFRGWHYLPFLSLDRQKEILKDSHHTASLFHINLFQEYLALFPELVSPNSADERINIPGRVLDTNWTYRFRKKVEEIASHSSLKQTMKEIIA